MRSLTDMVDHIQLIIKTLQVFDNEVDQLKKDANAIDATDSSLQENIRLINDRLTKLTTRSEKALKIVEVCVLA